MTNRKNEVSAQQSLALLLERYEYMTNDELSRVTDSLAQQEHALSTAVFARAVFAGERDAVYRALYVDLTSCRKRLREMRTVLHVRTFAHEW